MTAGNLSALRLQLQTSEVERLRLGAELRTTIALGEALRERAEAAEARIASVSGATREELVANEREACARLMEGDHRTADGRNCDTRARGEGTTTAEYGCGNCGRATAIRARGGA